MTPKILVNAIRTLGGMSQLQVATAAGLPQGTISKIEREAVQDIMSKSYLALLMVLHGVLDQHKAIALQVAQCKVNAKPMHAELGPSLFAALGASGPAPFCSPRLQPQF